MSIVVRSRSFSDRRMLAFIGFAIASVILVFGRSWWATEHSPWWSPFAIWCALVVAGFGLARPAVCADEGESSRR